MDVSKTNDLIAGARELVRTHLTPMEHVARGWADASSSQEAEKLDDCAAHLRAAVAGIRQLTDALEAATRVPVQGEPTGINLMRDLGYDESDHEVVQARADAVQGEPNDDRDLAEVIRDSWRGVQTWSLMHMAELAADAIRARATVPDAATAALERVRAMVEEMGDAVGFDRLVHGHEAEYPVSYLRDKIEEVLDGAPEPEVKP